MLKLLLPTPIGQCLVRHVGSTKCQVMEITEPTGEWEGMEWREIE
jgi:hypothetical protein